MSAKPHRVMSTLFAVAAIAALGACGGDDSADSPPPGLSPAGLEGREVALDAGCASCHGRDGQGGAGPTWVGLAGRAVELSDGSTVTADTEYLMRAILDPNAERVDGFAVKMPENDLSDEDAAKIVAYIEELAG